MQRAKIFKVVERIENSYNEARFGNQPHHMSTEEHDDWADASEMGFRPTPKTVKEVQALVKLANPVRWRQCQSNYRWLQKQMKKMGLNPEDARYIL